MPKVIPIELLAHKASRITTRCRLMKLKCRDGDVYGLANLDVDVPFNDLSGDGDSNGEINYLSTQSISPMTLSAAAGTSVDNSSFRSVVVDLMALGLTEDQLRAGKLDYADVWVYEVNYLDLTPGRREIKGRGKTGIVTLEGREFSTELRTLTQHYKQGIGAVTSIYCRALFGSMPIGTGGEQPEERYPCGKPWVWTAFTITEVSGTEADRIFAVSGPAAATGFYEPGVLRMISGDNAGYEVEVETYTSDSDGKVIAISLPAYFDFAVGDEGEIRQDCTKIHDDTEHGCQYHWGADWVLHNRSEHRLPLGQEGELSTPGAEL